MSDGKDYYKILGIEKEATAEQVKSAFRRVAAKYHPDRNPGDKDAEHKFKEAVEAYEVLSNPEKRKLYDAYGHEGLKGQAQYDYSSASWEDLIQNIFSRFDSPFDDIFGMGGGRRGSRGKPVGASLRIETSVPLKDAVLGCSREFSFYRHEPCNECGGTGSKDKKMSSCTTCGGQGQVYASRGFFSLVQTCPNCGGQGSVPSSPCGSCKGRGVKRMQRSVKVEIPAGIDNGTRIRMKGQGEHVANGVPGDLYVDIYVEEDPKFKREGLDLLLEQPIPFPVAALGGEIEIESIDGKKYNLKIKGGIQSGEVLRMRGAGINDSDGRTGDLYVRINIDVPKKLSSRQKEILREFMEEEKKERGFFGKLFN